jgi:hypothetical protein
MSTDNMISIEEIVVGLKKAAPGAPEYCETIVRFLTVFGSGAGTGWEQHRGAAPDALSSVVAAVQLCDD